MQAGGSQGGLSFYDGLDNWPFKAEVTISDYCAEGMAANQIVRGPRVVNVMKEGRPCEPSPGNQEVWDLRLRLGHFSVIPSHPLSLGFSVIVLETERANPISQF